VKGTANWGREKKKIEIPDMRRLPNGEIDRGNLKGIVREKRGGVFQRGRKPIRGKAHFCKEKGREDGGEKPERGIMNHKDSTRDGVGGNKSVKGPIRRGKLGGGKAFFAN